MNIQGKKITEVTRKIHEDRKLFVPALGTTWRESIFVALGCVGGGRKKVVTGDLSLVSKQPADGFKVFHSSKGVRLVAP